MSDSSISIVPRISNYPENTVKAKEILNWLIHINVVESKPSNCILSSKSKGFSISNGAKLITLFPENLPFDLITNGLEGITERQVFDTGENFIDELICPNCKENIAFDEWDLSYWNNNTNDNLTCPKCMSEEEIHNYKFEPDWGFSNLGFTFWNWPGFSDKFFNEFEKKLNCEISIIEQYL